jgi:hypothetical protein
MEAAVATEIEAGTSGMVLSP